MTPRLKLLIALALACASLTAATSSAMAARGMEVAVQDDSVFVSQFKGMANRAKGLALAQQLRATWIRANVDWSYVVGKNRKKRSEPKKISYNWSGYDALIRAAAAKGIHVELGLVGPAPAYATGNHKVGVDRVKASAFKRFAQAAAQHFQLLGVHRYAIWNEPNLRAWLSPLNKAPSLYRGMYANAYNAIKAADPNSQVLIGETSPYSLAKGRNAMSPLQFLRGVTCATKSYKRAHNCATLKADGYAHHPYDFAHKPTYKYPGADNVTMRTLSRLTSALSKLRNARLLQTPSGDVPQLYLTEYGFFSSGKYKLSRSRQGSYLVQGFKMAQKNPHVKQVLQFLLATPTGNFKAFDTSIVTRKGGATKAFNLLKSWAQKAAKAGQIAVAKL
jgi:Cellulase (glycosyl hydrolase family 5)